MSYVLPNILTILIIYTADGGLTSSVNRNVENLNIDDVIDRMMKSENIDKLVNKIAEIVVDKIDQKTNDRTYSDDNTIKLSAVDPDPSLVRASNKVKSPDSKLFMTKNVMQPFKSLQLKFNQFSKNSTLNNKKNIDGDNSSNESDNDFSTSDNKDTDENEKDNPQKVKGLKSAKKIKPDTQTKQKDQTNVTDSKNNETGTSKFKEIFTSNKKKQTIALEYTNDASDSYWSKELSDTTSVKDPKVNESNAKTTKSQSIEFQGESARKRLKAVSTKHKIFDEYNSENTKNKYKTSFIKTSNKEPFINSESEDKDILLGNGHQSTNSKDVFTEEPILARIIHQEGNNTYAIEISPDYQEYQDMARTSNTFTGLL